MLIYLDIKIPHLQIAHQGGNLEVANIKIHRTLNQQITLISSATWLWLLSSSSWAEVWIAGESSSTSLANCGSTHLLEIHLSKRSTFIIQNWRVTIKTSPPFLRNQVEGADVELLQDFQVHKGFVADLLFASDQALGLVVPRCFRLRGRFTAKLKI